MIDCGASSNFISANFVRKYDIPIHATADISQVRFADGSTTQTNNVTELVTVQLENKYSNESFIVLPLASYDAIIGMPYLQKFNPNINWRQQSVTFSEYSEQNPAKTPQPQQSAQ